MPRRTRRQLTDEVLRLVDEMSVTHVATRPVPWMSAELSLPQLKALYVLQHGGPMRVGTVRRMLSMSPNATTAVLDRLEQDGVVRRLPDPTDRRATLVELTAPGADRLAELQRRSLDDVRSLLERLATPELQALHEGLAALNRVLQESAADTSSSKTVTQARGRRA